MYRQMNEYLRNEKDDERGTYRGMVHTMIAEMCNAPRLDRKLIVYRLVNESVINNLINCNKNGEPMQEKVFLSTSLMKKRLWKIMNLLHMIIYKKSMLMRMRVLFIRMS